MTNLIDRRLAKELLGEVEALWTGKMPNLGQIERDKYALTVGRTSFGPKTMKITLEISVKDDSGAPVETEEMRNWKLYAPYKSNGVLKDTDLGRTFVSIHSKDSRTIVGFAYKNRKYPVIVADSRGNRWKLPLWHLPGMPGSMANWMDEPEAVAAAIAAPTANDAFMASLEALRRELGGI